MTVVLDASAVLAMVLMEEGAEEVSNHVADAHLSTVNLSESMAKLIDYGVPIEKARQQIARLDLTIHDFDAEQAAVTAVLKSATKELGLSLGDRACLALGQTLSLPILTSDRRMAEAKTRLDLDIRMIR